MPLTFQDAHGNRGTVTDALEVEYAGDWADDVESCVARVVDDRDADGGRRPRNVHSELVVELPDAAPVVEVERTDASLLGAAGRR